MDPMVNNNNTISCGSRVAGRQDVLHKLIHVKYPFDIYIFSYVFSEIDAPVCEVDRAAVRSVDQEDHNLPLFVYLFSQRLLKSITPEPSGNQHGHLIVTNAV